MDGLQYRCRRCDSREGRARRRLNKEANRQAQKQPPRFIVASIDLDQCPVIRPCDRVECRYNLQPGCIDEWIDEGGLTCDQVGSLLGMTGRRAQQIEKEAIEKLKMAWSQLYEE
jgi:hypothetical protein